MQRHLFLFSLMSLSFLWMSPVYAAGSCKDKLVGQPEDSIITRLASIKQKTLSLLDEPHQKLNLEDLFYNFESKALKRDPELEKFLLNWENLIDNYSNNSRGVSSSSFENKFVGKLDSELKFIFRDLLKSFLDPVYHQKLPYKKLHKIFSDMEIKTQNKTGLSWILELRKQFAVVIPFGVYSKCRDQ